MSRNNVDTKKLSISNSKDKADDISPSSENDLKKPSPKMENSNINQIASSSAQADLSSTPSPSSRLDSRVGSKEKSNINHESESDDRQSYPFRLTPTKSFLGTPESLKSYSNMSSPLGSPSQNQGYGAQLPYYNINHSPSIDGFQFFNVGNAGESSTLSPDKSMTRRRVRKWEKILDQIAHQKPSSSFDIQFESAFIGSSPATQIQNELIHVEQEYFRGIMFRSPAQVIGAKKLYEHIAQLSSSQLAEESPDASLSLAKERLVSIYQALSLFSMIRIDLLDIYACIADKLWLDPISLYTQISELQSQRALENAIGALFPLSDSFALEMGALEHIVKAEVGIKSHDFKDAVVNHHLSQRCLQKWETFLYSSSATKRVRAAGEHSILQFLKDVLDQQHSKIGLYFSSVIHERSAFANRSSVRRVQFQQHSYYQQICDYCERNYVTLFSLVYMMPPDPKFQAAYECPGSSESDTPTGIKSYPPLLSIPSTVPWHYWPALISLLQSPDMYPRHVFDTLPLANLSSRSSSSTSRFFPSVFGNLFSSRKETRSAKTADQKWDTPTLQHGEYITFVDKSLQSILCVCGLDERVVLFIVFRIGGLTSLNAFPEQETAEIFAYLSEVVSYRNCFSFSS